VLAASHQDAMLTPAREDAERQQQADQDGAGAGQRCDLRDRAVGLKVLQEDPDAGMEIVESASLMASPPFSMCTASSA